MKAIIIDNEPHILKTINFYLESNPMVEVVAKTTRAEEVVELIALHKPDIIFTDIELDNDILSFELLKQVAYKDYKIVFITGYQDYALTAIKFAAFDYLLKPISQAQINQVVERLAKETISNSLEQRLKALEENLENKTKRIVLKTTEKYIVVNPEEILHLEADNSYTHLFLTDNRHLIISKPIKSFEEMLSPNTFIRTHRSHIINITKVKEYLKANGRSIVMQNGKHIPLATNQKEAFLEMLNQ